MIYDYEESQKILDNFLIKEAPPLDYTDLEQIPIRHFTLGTGNKHIVVSASQHSNEIITTTFIIHLMNHLIKNNIIFKDLTIHFIPILNPEGYIVNTSAIRNKLSKNATESQIIKFCYEYYTKYKEDILFSKNNTIKQHQEFFKDTNYKAINNYYNMLKDSIREILSYHPKGSIIDWASNGNGIDLNSNNKTNIIRETEYNKQPQYNNIRIDIPSPIGHPGNTNDKNFQEEIEISSLKKLLQELNNKNTLIGYFNYHSIGGLIFQKPEINNTFFSIYNYLISKIYQENTIKNNYKYSIITQPQNQIITVNDHLRTLYPGNILIELSPMLGNPIGPFGDKNNFNDTIEYNIRSFIFTINNIINIYNISKELTNNTFSTENYYLLIDQEYDNIKRKILTK